MFKAEPFSSHKRETLFINILLEKSGWDNWTHQVQMDEINKEMIKADMPEMTAASKSPKIPGI